MNIKIDKMNIKIDKKIPIPNGRTKWPYAEMDVGDSFLAPKEKKLSVRAQLSSTGRRLQMKFISRTVDEGLRVWRIK